MMLMLLYIFGSFFFLMALINVLLSWWLRSFLNAHKRYQGSKRYTNTTSTRDNERHSDKQGVSPAVMTQCHICGTYIPKDTAYFKNDRYYCSQEHLIQCEKD